MTEKSSSDAAARVFTLNTISNAPRTIYELPPADIGLEALEMYQEAVAILRAEGEKVGGNVFFTSGDQRASLLQSLVTEQATVTTSLSTGGLEAQFGDGPLGGDIWGWISSLFDHVSKDRRHDILRPANKTADSFPDKASVAVVGDWGTNLYGAPVSAASIRRTGGFSLALHLGDIYYSGTPNETQQRFIAPWPTDAAKINRALNGNHEMYSGGFGYFDGVLPKFGQSSSYFAFENKHWLLVGLDTAYEDHTLDEQQVRWLNAVMAARGQRKAVFFSHHQPFSRLDSQGPKLQSALAALLGSRAITAWYWGHEHDCVIYNAHPTFGLLGRCIGHGGIPSPRKGVVEEAPAEKKIANVTWRRLESSDAAPSCIVLDGMNPYIVGEEGKFSPHGYLTLHFDGPELMERIHLPDGTVILEQKI